LTARHLQEGRMTIDFGCFADAHRRGSSATRPPAPRSPRHAALLVLAGISLPRPPALPATPITALAGAFNCRF
jgi:hypothetical protein